MIKRNVKSITVEYDNNDVDTFQEEGMYHLKRQFYRKGDTKPEEGSISNMIAWIDTKSMYPKES
jgi:hypothetical protein